MEESKRGYPRRLRVSSAVDEQAAWADLQTGPAQDRAGKEVAMSAIRCWFCISIGVLGVLAGLAVPETRAAAQDLARSQETGTAAAPRCARPTVHRVRLESAR